MHLSISLIFIKFQKIDNLTLTHLKYFFYNKINVSTFNYLKLIVLLNYTLKINNLMIL